LNAAAAATATGQSPAYASGDGKQAESRAECHTRKAMAAVPEWQGCARTLARWEVGMKTEERPAQADRRHVHGCSMRKRATDVA